MENEVKDWFTHMLELVNRTYTISNKGKEISFKSNIHGHEVRVFPTTGTYTFGSRTFRATSIHSGNEPMKDNLRKCVILHVNARMFGARIFGSETP